MYKLGEKHTKMQTLIKFIKNDFFLVFLNYFIIPDTFVRRLINKSIISRYFD